MSRLIYIANARLPSEKANGYQIVQMCEAFALNGHHVTLVIPRRRNTEAALRSKNDVWAYYAVRQNFKLVRLPCIDLIWLLDNQFSFLLQTLTFFMSLMLWLITRRFDKLFTRDHFIMAGVSLFVPRHKLIYEVHNKLRSARGQSLQRWLLKRVGTVVSLTGSMAKQLKTLQECKIIVAHDGIRPERFQVEASRDDLRGRFDIPQAAFVVCYAGRLHTMGMGKGLETLVEAAKNVPDLHFLLVGGPEAQVEALRENWPLSPEQFIAVGSVPPADVPLYLKCADVCIITSPQNEFFAYETSPMKLFEYMMAGRAIIASDLPSTREVVSHLQSAFLIRPSDVEALVRALKTLQNDPELRNRLAENAAKLAQNYTWQARAAAILPA